MFQLKIKKYYLNFFCFLYPTNIFKSLHQIIFLSCLLSLSWILKFINKLTVVFMMKLSFDTIPIIFSGLFFGPIIGVFTAICSDLIGWLLFFSYYPFFWGYTLQTALIGFIGGIFCIKNQWFFKQTIKTQNRIKNLIFLLCLLLNIVNIALTQTNIYFFIISILSTVVFIFLLNLILSLKNKKTMDNNFKLLLYISCGQLITSTIVSFILGPHFVKQYINKFLMLNSFSLSFEEFSFFLLITRILKESIKAPVSILIISQILSILPKYTEKYSFNYEKTN